jgi:hypothetical protein
VVVAIGIYVGSATPDAGLMAGGDFTALPTMTVPLRVVVERATDRLGRPVRRRDMRYEFDHAVGQRAQT